VRQLFTITDLSMLRTLCISGTYRLRDRWLSSCDHNEPTNKTEVMRSGVLTMGQTFSMETLKRD